MKHYIIPFILCALLFTGCIKDDYFGESELANITTFKIKGQINNSIVTGDLRDTRYVYISISKPMNAS